MKKIVILINMGKGKVAKKLCLNQFRLKKKTETDPII